MSSQVTSSMLRSQSGQLLCHMKVNDPRNMQNQYEHWYRSKVQNQNNLSQISTTLRPCAQPISRLEVKVTLYSKNHIAAFCVHSIYLSTPRGIFKLLCRKRTPYLDDIQRTQIIDLGLVSGSCQCTVCSKFFTLNSIFGAWGEGDMFCTRNNHLVRMLVTIQYFQNMPLSDNVTLHVSGIHFYK